MAEFETRSGWFVQIGSAGLASALCLGLVLLGPAARVAHAALIPTASVGDSPNGATQRATLEALIDRPEVARELMRLGVSPDEAHARIAALSDEELAQVAGQLDALPAGEGAVGAIVGAALVVFLVLLLTDILGFTDVFPWVIKRAR